MPRPGRVRAAGALGVIAAVAAVLCTQSPAAAAVRTGPAPRPATRPQTRSIRVARAVRAVRPPRPWTIAVPAIGVAAHLIRLGGPAAAEVLALPVPALAEAATEAGWYQFSAVPGAAGNAVIVAHVDTYAGPGVFYNLYQLRPGNLIYVTAGDGRQRFDVTSIRELPKPVFPVNQVFGDTKKHALWLITCGGDFDYVTRHYLDNIVVSAAWDPPRKTQAARSSRAKERIIRHKKFKKTRAKNSRGADKRLRLHPAVQTAIKEMLNAHL